MAPEDAENATRTWLVTRAGHSMQLSIHRDGLRLTDGTDESFWLWEQITEIGYPTSFSMRIESVGGEQVQLGFLSSTEARMFRRHIDGEASPDQHQTHPSLEHPGRSQVEADGGEDAARPERSNLHSKDVTAPSRGVELRMSTQGSSGKWVKGQWVPSRGGTGTGGISPVGYIAVGVGLLFIGAVVFAASFQSEYDFSTGATSSNGAGMFFAAVLLGLGQIVALIGVVAQGVKVGNQSS